MTELLEEGLFFCFVFSCFMIFISCCVIVVVVVLFCFCVLVWDYGRVF